MQKLAPRKLISALLPIVLGIVIAYSFFRNIRADAFWGYFTEIQVLPCFFILLLILLTVALKAQRWRSVFSAHVRPSFKTLSSSLIVGTVFDTILPLRLGDAVRAWYASRRSDASFSGTLGSIAIERMLDLFSVIYFAGICLSIGISLTSGIVRAIKFASILFFSAIVFSAILYTARRQLRALAHSGVRQFPALSNSSLVRSLSASFQRFIDEVCSAKSVKNTYELVFMSIVIWALIALVYYAGFLAFGISVSPRTALLVTTCISLSISIPSAPAHLGTFQLGCVIAIHTISGFDFEFALAYSVFMQVIQMGFMLLLGLPIIFGQNDILSASWQYLRPQFYEDSKKPDSS